MNFKKLLLGLISKAVCYSITLLLVLYAFLIPQYLAPQSLNRITTPLGEIQKDVRHAVEGIVGTQPDQELQKLVNAKRPYTDSVGRPKCFNKSMVNSEKPCASCVNFLTIANKDSRWSSIETVAEALRIVSTNLRMSQFCFNLHVYTNIRGNSSEGNRLALAGGSGVEFYPFPKTLPKNGYTGRDRWLELSRRKLDVVLMHMARFGHKVIWTDLDTIVLTDLSCAYSQLSNFVVSRNWAGHSLRGPKGRSVRIRDGYSVYGDLWMIDDRVADHVSWLEKMGMPTPKNDLQDYFAYMLNLCNGTVTDLRGYLRDGNDTAMCMGFDFAGGHHPKEPHIAPMRVKDDHLYCSVIRERNLVYRKFATMSFIMPLFQMYRKNPRLLFKTNDSASWGQAHGFRLQS